MITTELNLPKAKQKAIPQRTALKRGSPDTKVKAKKQNILEYIEDHRILYEKEDATPEELEAVHKRQNERQQFAGGEYNRVLELLKKIRESGPLSEEEKIELQRLIKTLTAQGIDIEALEKKYVAGKPKSNGKYTMPTINLDSFDWDLWLRQHDKNYETLEEEKNRKTQVDENLFEKYLELLKSGELLPGTTFKMFERNYLDYDADVFTKIKKRADDKKRVEGIAALLGVDPGRSKT